MMVKSTQANLMIYSSPEFCPETYNVSLFHLTSMYSSLNSMN